MHPNGLLRLDEGFKMTASILSLFLFSSQEEDWSLCENGTKNEGASRGAVEDFANEHNLKIFTTTEDFPTWMMQKPY
jgi:hypothetical protein